MQQRPQWGSRIGFILAASGSAIGLGNVWKFPYVTGENGGGWFVLIYLICIATVGLPLLVCEMSLGQRAQANVIKSYQINENFSSLWQNVGRIAALAAFLMLTYYFAVGGWLLDFLMQSVARCFGWRQEIAADEFALLLSSPGRQLFWHSLFTIAVMISSLSGFKAGIETVNKFLMPSLFLLLIGMLIYAVNLSGFPAALNFLFSLNTENLKAESILEALGHAFFTLSLGIGVMVTYGSYLPKTTELPKIALAIGLLDTIVALIAGIIVFSVVFSFNDDPSSGPGLLFVVLPQLFQKMPASQIVSVAFFLFVSFAAFSSAISAFEVNVAQLHENLNISRTKATIICGLGIYFVGIFVDGSHNIFAHWRILGLSIFDAIDHLVSNFLLPIGGFLTAIFSSWIVSRQRELIWPEGKGWPRKLLIWVTKVVTPTAVFLIFLNFL